MILRTEIEKRTKMLSYFHSRSQPFYQGILNIDLNEQTGNKTLSATRPVEFFVKLVNLPQINHEVLADHLSITLEDFRQKLLCELEKLAVVFTHAVARHVTLDELCLTDDAMGILTGLFPFIQK